jgi:two-component system, cell cycle sensor histidine kinase and response regulator CckA
MPGITGTDLTRKLLAIRADIPVVLMTGHYETIAEKEARAAGAMALLTKPFGSEEIARMVRAVFENEAAGSKV